MNGALHRLELLAAVICSIMVLNITNVFPASGYSCRSAAGIEVEMNGALHRLELLAVLEFSSDRKRMSVVVRQHDDDSSGSVRLRLLCKGADNVMLERLKGER